MESKFQKINSSLSSIKGWLRNRFLESLSLLKMIRFKSPLQFIWAQILFLLIYSLIYPILRVFFGREKAHNICNSFLNTHLSSMLLLSLPSPLESKIMMHWADFGLYREIYSEDIYSQEILMKEMNVVDIGAHVGTYTILAAEKVGKNGKVIAIEPDPKNYKYLLKNIKLNNFQNVIPINIALADRNGSEKLYLHFSSMCHSLISQEDKNSYIKVPVKTVDKLVEELNLKKIDVIKIDTEGAEMPILRGAEKTLKANPNVKLFIASYHYPSEIQEVCQFLNKRGFETKISQNTIVTTIQKTGK